jgi:hypothetical protein
MLKKSITLACASLLLGVVGGGTIGYMARDYTAKKEVSQLEEFLRTGLALNHRDEQRDLHYIRFNMCYQDGPIIRRIMKADEHFIRKEDIEKFDAARILAGDEAFNKYKEHLTNIDQLWVQVESDDDDIKYILWVHQKGKNNEYLSPSDTGKALYIPKENINKFIKKVLVGYPND